MTGDDTAALAARQRLAPLLAGISDPFLHAICQLAIAWSLPITGDYDGALREVTVSLGELRGQDEPVYTAMAASLTATWRRRWAATTRPSATCTRRATWRSDMALTGFSRPPLCSWASWLSCGAGSMRPAL